MLVRLLRDARIHHKAGEIVDVSPAEFGFLTSTNSAIPVAAQEKPVKKTTKKK